MRFGLANRVGRGVRLGLDFRSNYQPSDEGGLVLDFDATVPASYTVSGGLVSQITNIASGASWAQAASGKRAAYDATGWNGGPCWVPDGVDDIYVSTEAAVLAVLNAPVSAPAYTLCVVCQPTVSLFAGTVFGCGNSGFSNTRRRKWGTTNNDRWVYTHTLDNATQFTVFSANNKANAGTKRLITWYGQSSQFQQVDRGEVTGGSGSPVVTTINQAALFARPDSDPDNFWTGKFVRLLLFDSQLNADALARVQDHLQSKHL